MSRVSRKSLNFNCFHVIVQGFEKKFIFEKDEDKRKYRKTLFYYANKYNLKILAYCIMGNHIHILVFCNIINDLSKCMHAVNTIYARYYNDKNKRVGYVYRDRFKSFPIKSLKQLYKTLIYIHLNPVKAHITETPEKYLFSSYNDYLKYRGIVNKECLKILKFNFEDYKNQFIFMHYIDVIGMEFDDKLDKEKIKLIEKYIKENKIIDIIFQSEKIEKMINVLEDSNITFNNIAQYFGVSSKRLKEIILK